MRFILVKCARMPEWDWAHAAGWDQYRATCGASGVDMFLWAVSEADAQIQVLNKFPSATFAGVTLH